MSLLRELEAKAVERGDLLAENMPEIYDWEAACGRVERILNEYGESLPTSPPAARSAKTSAVVQKPADALHEAKRFAYLNSWKHALGTFLGWPEERVLKWAEEEYDWFLNMPNSWFYNTGAMFYVVPCLVPESLRQLTELRPRIQTAIECRISPPIPESLRQLRARMNAEDWLAEFEKYRQQAVSRGDWFSEDHADQYDWQAARARVEKILREYGGALPRGR